MLRWLDVSFLYINTIIYLLLTEFEVHTVNYGSSFFPLIFMAQEWNAQAINEKEKNEEPTYGMDQENKDKLSVKYGTVQAVQWNTAHKIDQSHRMY